MSVFTRNWQWTKAQGKTSEPGEEQKLNPIDFPAELFGNQIKITLPDDITAGRFEIVNDSPVKIIDGAHNYEGVEILLRNYENKYGHLNTDIFLGFKKGKDINNILNLIVGKTNYNLHLIEDDTFFDQEITKEIGYLLDKYGKNYKIASLEQFKKNKNPSILLGSLYLIGEYKKRIIT